MSNFRSLNSEKQESAGATIGFRFHANDEELEEVQLSQDNDVKNPDENSKPKTDSSSTVTENVLSEAVKDQRNLLGKRSISVDSAYESPFSNPIETWKKLNVLKEKIAKTVEEKFLEKIDRNVLSKSSRSRLSQSKESSSISDSEDTSESSKLSDQLRYTDRISETEIQTSSLENTASENPEINITTSDISQDNKNQPEVESKDTENELRNRKNFTNVSEFVNLPDIKIATAKADGHRNQTDENLTDVESGVEADENLDATEESFDLEDSMITSAGGSNTPPCSENGLINYFYSITSRTSTIAFLIGIMFYLIFPMSEFFRGFLLCLMIVLFWDMITSSKKPDDSVQQHKSVAFTNFNSLPPLKVPKSKAAKGIWFNEYVGESYDPEMYSVTQTVPAYLELENNMLKISRPKGKVRRRATYDEPEYKLPIINERIFNICGCNVYLLPDGLTRKRLFSKKYPIVIFLKPDSLVSERKRGKEIDEKEAVEDAEAEENNSANPESPKNKTGLYLFARCDRQKEEWYRRLLSASKGNQNHEKIVDSYETMNKDIAQPTNDDSPAKESSTPFENLFFDNEEAYLEEYMQYMTSFVHETIFQDPSSLSRNSKSKDTQKSNGYSQESHVKNGGHRKTKSSRSTSFPEGLGKGEKEDFNYSGDHIQWLNAVLNRILFDVFRSPHWHDKLQQKLYRKLNSIRLPYYIENLEVIEFDLGKTGPVFNRVSQPYLDECGLWFDMGLTFEGLIRLTIQTHLNLIKLQKGAEEAEETTLPAAEKPKKEKHSRAAEKEPQILKETRSAIYDSELEDSAESSDEDEEEVDPPPTPDNEEPVADTFVKRYPRSRRSSKKIFKVFENVARSKYFRSMAQSKYIQKAIAGVSAAKLRLSLEVKSCTGVIAVNIPPPPSDRFWFGFREMPKLTLSANPKIGDKAVRFVHIKNYLQKKILHEFKKVLVVPNMIDFVLPTSVPACSSSFIDIEGQEDLDEATLSEGSRRTFEGNHPRD